MTRLPVTALLSPLASRPVATAPQWPSATPPPDHAIGLEKWIRYQRRLYPYGLIFLAGVTGLLAWVLFALIAMG